MGGRVGELCARWVIVRGVETSHPPTDGRAKPTATAWDWKLLVTRHSSTSSIFITLVNATHASHDLLSRTTIFYVQQTVPRETHFTSPTPTRVDCLV